jgi:L,D-transpeptidase ErfK/SrfK
MNLRLGPSLAVVVLLSGCTPLSPRDDAAPAAVDALPRPDPTAPRLAALETRHFEVAAGQDLIGQAQVIFARYENTFSSVGRRYNLGYEEMRRANPGVDQWLPGEGDGPVESAAVPAAAAAAVALR